MDTTDPPVIHIDGATLLDTLRARGWAQGAWENDKGICAHQCIRLCQPVPGDAYLIEQVANRRGRGPSWNDAATTTREDVEAWLGAGVDVTDADLAETFGPQWRAVVALVRRAATMTASDIERLRAAGAAAVDAVWDAARDAAGAAAVDAARDAVWDAARDAAGVAATWDLATDDGPYTTAHRDLLVGPWLTVQPDLVDRFVEVAS